MSDEVKATNADVQAAANAEAAGAQKFTIKFDGKEVVYDLSKPEDKARLQTDAQLGRFSQKQTEKLQQLTSQLAEREKDPALLIGRSFQEYMARDPLGASTLGETLKALQEGRVDPMKVRATLLGQDGSEASDPAAQARAMENPQTRAALQQVLAELQSVKGRTDELASAYTRRAQDEAIRGTLSGQEWLQGKPAAQAAVERRTRELVAQGTDLQHAALLAVEEARTLVDEAANTEAARLRQQKSDGIVKTSAGVPPIGDFLAKKVDPKATPRQQREQRIEALKDRYRAMVRSVENGLTG